MKRRIRVVFVLFLLFLTLNQPIDPSTQWQEFTQREGNEWIVHRTDHHTIRSIYGISARSGSTPEDAASGFLKKQHPLLDIDHLSDLRLVRVEESEIGSHFYYQQYFFEVPVVGADVAIHVNKQNRVIAANSRFRPGLRAAVQTIQPAAEAEKRIIRFLSGSIASGGKLMALPVDGWVRLVWKFEVDSTRLSRGSRVVFVDAERPNLILRAYNTHATFEGRGNIFFENPVVTPDREFQTLKYMNGSKKLSGRFNKALDANGQFDIDNPIELSDYTTESDDRRRFDFPPADLRLAEVMAYFHMTRIHDHWQEIGFRKLKARAPAFVNVAETDGGPGFDNAFYSRSSQFPKTGIYVFGAGDQLENLGIDADVFYHEYGHGVLDTTNPEFFGAIESNYTFSFHEGFADVSAVSLTGNPKLGEFALRLKKSKRFVGRNLQNSNSFSADVIDPSIGKSESHHTGLIFGGAWWDLHKRITSRRAQEILFHSLALLPNEITFFDVRDALFTADANANSGVNRQSIQNAFAAHGLGGDDPGQPGKLTITRLRTALFNLQTGELTPQSSFRRGDIIAVLADYNAAGVTPAYNIIPEFVTLTGPGGGSTELFGFLVADEAVKGKHAGVNGALQAVLFTDSITVPGFNRFGTRARLGGTTTLTPKRSVRFEVN